MARVSSRSNTNASEAKRLTRDAHSFDLDSSPEIGMIGGHENIPVAGERAAD